MSDEPCKFFAYTELTFIACFRWTCCMQNDVLLYKERRKEEKEIKNIINKTQSHLPKAYFDLTQINSLLHINVW